MTLRAVGRGEAAGALRFVAAGGDLGRAGHGGTLAAAGGGRDAHDHARGSRRASRARQRPVRGPLRARGRHAGGGGNPAGLGRRGAQERPPRAAAGPVGRAGTGVYDEGGRVQRRGHLPAGLGRPPPVRPLRHREFHLRLRGRPAGRRMALPRAAGQPAGLEFAGLAHVPRRRAAPVRVPRGPGRDPVSESVARGAGANRCGWGTSIRSERRSTTARRRRRTSRSWRIGSTSRTPPIARGVLLRFSRKVPATLHLPPSIPQADGQAAVEFPVRSGDEVSLGFATPEELPRGKWPTAGP